MERLICRLMKHLTLDAVKAAFPLKGEKQKKHYLFLSRVSPSQVILDVFHPPYEVIFPAGVCGSFPRFFIWQPAVLTLSGRRSGALTGQRLMQPGRRAEQPPPRHRRRCSGPCVCRNTKKLPVFLSQFTPNCKLLLQNTHCF